MWDAVEVTIGITSGRYPNNFYVLADLKADSRSIYPSTSAYVQESL
jgi:hypothetical protein